MSDVIIPTRYQWRRDTAANWTANNPTPKQGEPCLETDTTWPNGGGRKFKIGDGTTAWNSLPYAVPDIGSSGQPDASSEYYFREDFGRAIVNVSGFTISNTEYAPICYGSGTATMGTPAANAPGVVTLSTGSSTSAQLRLVPVGFQLVPGGGVMKVRCRFRIPTLSNGTQDFLTLFGLFDTVAGTTNNLIDCLYNHATNSGHYQLRTRSGGTTTTANAAVGPAANTWTTVEIQINAAASSVSLLVDGVSVATNTANIPTAAMTMAFWLNKNAGATARTVDVDYMEARIAFPSGR